MRNKCSALLTLVLVTLFMLACNSLPFAGTNVSPQNTIPEQEVIIVTSEPTIMSEPEKAGNQKCNNIFYPLILENEWIYEFQGQEESSQMGMSVSELDSGDIVVNMLGLETGITSQTQIQCEDTTIVNFPLISMGLLMGNYLDGDIELTHVSGIFMPNESTFTDSNWITSWQGEYSAKGSMYIDYEGDEAMVTLDDSPIRMQWSIPEEGQPTTETITVQAGTFEDAARIHRTVEMDASVNLSSDGSNFIVDGTIILEQTLWYKAGVGLLRQQIDEASIKAFGIQYPMILDGTIELVEFRN